MQLLRDNLTVSSRPFASFSSFQLLQMPQFFNSFFFSNIFFLDLIAHLFGFVSYLTQLLTHFRCSLGRFKVLLDVVYAE